MHGAIQSSRSKASSILYWSTKNRKFRSENDLLKDAPDWGTTWRRRTLADWGCSSASTRCVRCSPPRIERSRRWARGTSSGSPRWRPSDDVRRIGRGRRTPRPSDARRTSWISSQMRVLAHEYTSQSLVVVVSVRIRPKRTDRFMYCCWWWCWSPATRWNETSTIKRRTGAGRVTVALCGRLEDVHLR